jgi:hypothetical protein
MSDGQKPAVDLQAGTLNWIQRIVTWAIISTFSVCAWSIYNLNQKPEPPKDNSQIKANLTPDKSIYRAQNDSLMNAYNAYLQQRVPVILSLRIAAIGLMAVLAMILLRIGASVIVHKSGEQHSEIKEGPWISSLAPTSPGLIMILLGTILLLVTIYFTFNVEEALAKPPSLPHPKEEPKVPKVPKVPKIPPPPSENLPIPHKYGRFVVISSNPKIDHANMTRLLENYTRFFAANYELTSSQEIKVYVDNDHKKMNSRIFKSYGFKLGEGFSAYSSLDDASLYVVLNPKLNPNWENHLTHALFHFLVRRAVPDIPSWLDEGMARLPADAIIEKNKILGFKDSWRTEYLDRNWHKRPCLDELMRMRGNELDEYQCKSSSSKQVNIAAAYAFVKYLHERGKLKKIVDKLRQHQPKQYTDSPEADAIKVVEKVLGKSLEKIDAEFAVAFRAAPHACR